MNIAPFIRSRPLGKVNVPTVTLAHGGGGKAMKDLIDDVFVAAFDNASLAPLEDQARFDLSEIAAHGDRLAFTTDSFVVDPLMFPGGDIGKLAVCGTINDLAVGGARPLYLSCAVIIEEGVPIDLLRHIARSMAETARAAGVEIVTGDTKVVHKGACDKLFIITTGIGAIREGLTLGAHLARPGDMVLVNGLLGDHGAAILGARGDMAQHEHQRGSQRGHHTGEGGRDVVRRSRRRFWRGCGRRGCALQRGQVHARMPVQLHRPQHVVQQAACVAPQRLGRREALGHDEPACAQFGRGLGRIGRGIEHLGGMQAQRGGRHGRGRWQARCPRAGAGPGRLARGGGGRDSRRCGRGQRARRGWRQRGCGSGLPGRGGG